MIVPRVALNTNHLAVREGAADDDGSDGGGSAPKTVYHVGGYSVSGAVAVAALGADFVF